MKSQLLPCAAAGLACTFPVWAGAQVSGGRPGGPMGMPPGRIPDAPARKRESASSPAPAKPVMVDCAAGVATKARPAG